jgi:hypothetical protein
MLAGRPGFNNSVDNARVRWYTPAYLWDTVLMGAEKSLKQLFAETLDTGSAFW